MSDEAIQAAIRQGGLLRLRLAMTMGGSGYVLPRAHDGGQTSVIARSVSDEAIQAEAAARWIASPSARNDEEGSEPEMKRPAVYIMASGRNGTLYTGVTSDLAARAYQHREGLIEGFAHRYHCTMLVFFEMHETMEAAISREKQLKAGSRSKKVSLIERANPDWADLYGSLF